MKVKQRAAVQYNVEWRFVKKAKGFGSTDERASDPMGRIRTCGMGGEALEKPQRRKKLRRER